MILITLLFLFAAPSRAQIAPAPTEAVRGDNLDDVFRRFNSGKPMIPTLKEVQAEQLKRDLAPRPGKEDSPEGASTNFANRNRPPLANVRRQTTESVDVAVSRPLPRVELGVGYSEMDVHAGNRRVAGDTSKYGFLRIDLSKIPLPRKFLHSPTAVHTETEVGEKVRVDSDEYTTRFLKHPTGD
jgi:hypothetical protein